MKIQTFKKVAMKKSFIEKLAEPCGIYTSDKEDIDMNISWKRGNGFIVRYDNLLMMENLSYKEVLDLTKGWERKRV